MIDLRCQARLPGPPDDEDTCRCQLLAGHEGDHAVMFCRAGRRTMRTWVDGDPHTCRDELVAQPTLPWMVGMPRPAWSEPP